MHVHTHAHTHTHVHPTESLEQIEWQRRYCVLVKEERKLYFFNDTEVRRT